MPLFYSIKTSEPSQSGDLLFPEAQHLPAVDENGTEASWIPSDEGRLSLDVFEDDDNIMVFSAIAGVKTDNLDVFLSSDMLTIRGTRLAPETSGRPLLQECHWGSFSRSVILPTEIDPDGITAAIKDGILTIRLPKINRSRKIKVKRG